VLSAATGIQAANGDIRGAFISIGAAALNAEKLKPLLLIKGVAGNPFARVCLRAGLTIELAARLRRALDPRASGGSVLNRVTNWCGRRN
jgi:hypothetical protein